jgi:hypothetical protein
LWERTPEQRLPNWPPDPLILIIGVHGQFLQRNESTGLLIPSRVDAAKGISSDSRLPIIIRELNIIQNGPKIIAVPSYLHLL